MPPAAAPLQPSASFLSAPSDPSRRMPSRRLSGSGSHSYHPMLVNNSLSSFAPSDTRSEASWDEATEHASGNYDANAPQTAGRPRRSRPSKKRRFLSTLKSAVIPVRRSEHEPHVYNVPREQITHIPAHVATLADMVLCPAFDPTIAPRAGPHAGCPAGPECKLVHADVRGREAVEPHHNAMYTSLDQVQMERFPSGVRVQVNAPRMGPPVAVVDSGNALRTRAFDSQVHVFSQPQYANAGDAPVLQAHHCSHFHVNRTCFRGSQCRFLHMVRLAPATTPAVTPAPVVPATAPAASPSTSPDAFVEQECAMSVDTPAMGRSSVEAPKTPPGMQRRGSRYQHMPYQALPLYIPSVQHS